MTTTRIFCIGTAERFEGGGVKYALGVEAFQSLDGAKRHLRQLYSYYANKGIALPPDEFVAVEVVTILHDDFAAAEAIVGSAAGDVNQQPAAPAAQPTKGTA